MPVKPETNKEGFFVRLFKQIWDNIQVCCKALNEMLVVDMFSNEYGH